MTGIFLLRWPVLALWNEAIFMQNLIEIRASTETGKEIEQVTIKLLERRQFLNNKGRKAEAEMIDTEIVKLQPEFEYCQT